ncbi:MAG: aldo/keto reductase [Opitutales bacterium]|nr:aldo/keto reductase [Opitutales bacterium]
MKWAPPKIIFGSSALGNLYGVVEDSAKRAIVAEWIARGKPTPVIDSAGKYGAGLALECIGRFLGELYVPPEAVTISNKLGWKRVPLRTDEPTFEPGAWFGLEHDAEQCIGYEGILECWRQGNELLGGYYAQVLSVHDPDEFVSAAASEAEAGERYRQVLDAYRALAELRDAGEALAVGVGAKDWRIIRRLVDDGVALDWVMFANAFTLFSHPPEVMAFMDTLRSKGITGINSAVFNAGFLTGGKYFDYRVVDRARDPELFAWRDAFMEVCREHGTDPAHACCQFALSPPAVAALALNTSRAERVADNVRCVSEALPSAFWKAIKARGLLEDDYPYL